MNGATPYDSDGGHPHVDNQNVAGAGSRVWQQNAVNYGDTTIHDDRTFNINPGDPPERRHEVALTHLAAGAPRIAERLLGELLWDGHATTERAFYFVLSVLSDRSMHSIDDELFTRLVHARKICASLPRDHWRDAFDAVWTLLRDAWQRVDDRAADGPPPDVYRAFDALPAVRRDEVLDHLGMILSDLDQERLDAGRAQRIATERVSGDRANRAWKFFEPVPARPREYEPAPPAPEPAHWVRGAVGVFGVLLGAKDVLDGPFSARAVLGLLLAVIGGRLMIRHGAVRQASSRYVAARLSEVTPPAQADGVRSPGHWVSTRFVEKVRVMVDTAFGAARPHRAGDWPGYTAGYRAHLTRRLVDLYGNARVTPASLDWLIRWHARQVAAGWGSQALFSYPLPPETATAGTWFGVGGLAGAAGLLGILLGVGGFAAGFVGLGGLMVVRSGIRVLASSRVHTSVLADARQLHADEVQAHQAWQEQLRDRPKDAEMARWLAMDRTYLKNDAVRRAGLTSGDMVRHVVTVYRTKNAMRARAGQGPMRYSAYRVQIFLLTRNGIREAGVDLDFLTGATKDEERTGFPYGALAAATVKERGTRTPGGNDPHGIPVERLRRSTLHLSLVNGREIAATSEGGGASGQETSVVDEPDLPADYLETSGIEDALRILETVATEGREWIAREQLRRERWSRDWCE